MAKIKMVDPVIERDGDGTARMMRSFIRNKPILPYLDIDPKCDGPGIETRDALTSVR